MKKTMMNYEAPVAEMIELQASMVLMNSGGGDQPDPSGGDQPGPSGGEISGGSIVPGDVPSGGF